MPELKKITIQLIENQPNIEIVDRETHERRYLEDQVYSKGYIVMAFANLYKDHKLNEHICALLLPQGKDDLELDLELYLIETYEKLVFSLGGLVADVILIDYINPIVEDQNKMRPLTMNYARKITDGFKQFCGLANVFAKIACSASENEDNYNLYSLTFEAAGTFANEVHYGVYPFYINGELSLYDVFTIESANAALLYDLACVAKQRIIIKACENCGKYFKPTSRSDEKYCDNIFRNGKTCKQLGYEIKINNDEILKTYRKIYKTQNARKQRNSDNISSINDRFKAWTEKAKIELRKCQEGLITVDQLSQNIGGAEWMTE